MKALRTLAVLLALGCADSGSDRQHGVQRIQRIERIELWGMGREGEVVAYMIPEFERRNPGIRVTVQQIPWLSAHEKLLTAYVGDAVPDVAQIGNTWIPEFVAVRGLAELTPLTRRSRTIDGHDDFPGIWATNQVDGALYGIPWYVDTRVLFYRSDVLAAVGYPHAPRTWSEWLEAMTRIQRERRCRFAILMPTNEFEPIEMLALSNGSSFLRDNGTRGAFEEPPFREAFLFYVNAFRRGFAPPVSNFQVANLYQQFAQGDFAMHITGPWNVGEFRRRLPPSMQGKWATAPLPARDARAPTGISMAGGSSLVIFAASRHQEAARRLIEFLSQTAQQLRLFELLGDLPARRSAWAAPALARDPYFAAFRQQLERVEPLPRVPEWEQIATVIFEQGEAAVRGAATPAAALAALDRTADDILAKRRWVLARQAAGR
ncbi:MAG TPA: sugar ABC transporter substrate-binding protein [Thermoanaerobaculia bacterium]|nr:sugar ABC transporter substrate-binding protein [Thermoanaerobaculia bacterium]